MSIASTRDLKHQTYQITTQNGKLKLKILLFERKKRESGNTFQGIQPESPTANRRKDISKEGDKNKERKERQ